MLSPMPVPTPRCHFSFVMATCTSPRPISKCATGSSSVQTSKLLIYSRPKTPRCVKHPRELPGVADTVCRAHLIFFAANSRDILFFHCNFSEFTDCRPYVSEQLRESVNPCKFLGSAFGKKSQMVGGSARTQRTRRWSCLLYTSPSPRDQRGSRMPSSA